MLNYYEILGVSEDASFEEIRQAYLRLAKQYHPDCTSDENEKKRNEEIMKEINEAYDILSNEEKRSHYDYQRSAGNSNRDDNGTEDGNFEYEVPHDDQYAEQSWEETKQQYSEEEQEYAEAEAAKILFEKLMSEKADYLATKEIIFYSLADGTDESDYISMMQEFKNLLSNFVNELVYVKSCLDKYSLSLQSQKVDEVILELDNLISEDDWDYLSSKKKALLAIRGKSVLEHINRVTTEANDLLDQLKVIIVSYYKKEMSHLDYESQYNSIREYCYIKMRMLEELFKKAKLNSVDFKEYADAEKTYEYLLKETVSVDIFEKAKVYGPILVSREKLSELVGRLERVRKNYEQHASITPYDSSLNMFLEDLCEAMTLPREFDKLRDENRRASTEISKKNSGKQFLNDFRELLLSFKSDSLALNTIFDKIVGITDDTFENISGELSGELKDMITATMQDINTINNADFAEAAISLKKVLARSEILINSVIHSDDNVTSNIEQGFRDAMSVKALYLNKLSQIEKLLKQDILKLEKELSVSNSRAVSDWEYNASKIIAILAPLCTAALTFMKTDEVLSFLFKYSLIFTNAIFFLSAVHTLADGRAYRKGKDRRKEIQDELDKCYEIRDIIQNGYYDQRSIKTK